MRSRWLLFALSLGLVVRLAFEFQLAPYPRHERIRNALDDQAFFVAWSSAMARGEKLDLRASPHEWAFWAARQPHLPPQAPLYPALLAVVSVLFGSSPGWIRGFQVAAGLACIAGVFLVAKRRFGEPTAALAAFGAALYAPWIFFEATVLRTSGLVFFFVAIVVALDRLPPPTDRSRRSRLAALGVGLLCGLAVLFQEQFLMLWIGGAIWLARCRHVAARQLVAGGVGLLLPLILWASFASGRRVASTASAPFNLLIANLHDAHGQVPSTTPTYDAIKLAAIRSPESIADPVTALAADLVRHPKAVVGLLVRKVAFLVAPNEIPDNVNFYLGKRENPALRWLPFDYPTLLPLALVGLLLAGRRARTAAPLGVLAALYAASLIAFVPLARLRQPLALVVIVFAAAGAVELWRRLQPRAPLALLALLAIAALLVAGGALRPESLQEIRPTDWQMAGGAWENEGQARLAHDRPAEARAAFIQALIRNPTAARAREALRAVEARLGYPTAPVLPPLSIAVEELCARGTLAAKQGDLSAAGQLLESAAREAPEHLRPWQLLANVHFLSGDRTAATVALERALALDPYDPTLARNLAALRGLPAPSEGRGAESDWTPRASLP